MVILEKLRAVDETQGPYITGLILIKTTVMYRTKPTWASLRMVYV